MSLQDSTRAPFSANLIPQNRLNAVAAGLAAYYLPGSSVNSGPFNLSRHPRNTAEDSQGGSRIDAALARQHHLYAQLFHQNSPVNREGLFPFSGQLFTTTAEVAMLQHTWVMSPRMVNTLRAGFVRSVAEGGNEGQSLGPILSSLQFRE